MQAKRLVCLQSGKRFNGVELTGSATRDTGEEMRMSMAEVFVMRDGKIAELRAWVIELKADEYR